MIWITAATADDGKKLKSWASCSIHYRSFQGRSSQPISMPDSFCPGIELCSTVSKKLVQEKLVPDWLTHVQDNLHKFLVQISLELVLLANIQQSIAETMQMTYSLSIITIICSFIKQKFVVCKVWGHRMTVGGPQSTAGQHKLSCGQFSQTKVRG